MCRHLAYLGPPVTLAALLLDPPHGLLHQSYAPADMRGGGTVNADGFGAGWYPPARGPADRPGATAATARSGPTPHSPRSRAVTHRAGVLAAVRSATPGPARHRGGGRAVRRGAVAVQPQRADPRLARRRGRARRPSCPSRTCSPWTPPPTPRCCGPWSATACGRATTRRTCSPTSCAPSPPRPPESRLNLLLTDGTTIWATTWTHALSVRVGEGAVDGRVRALRRRPRVGRRPGPAPGRRHPQRLRGPVAGHRRARRRHRGRLTAAGKESHGHPDRPDRRPPHSRRRPRRPAGGRAARVDVAAQAAAAEVLLRRAGQRVVRGDHGTARVLPDAHRSGAAHRARRRDRAADRGDDAGRARVRDRRRRPGCCSTRSPGAARCAGTSRWT